ncbi:MAG: M20/M25/M40 family metallo-hydrolase, partial [Anaerolineales bacterium]|nr:M20/M25/M40 family metallo-hydrolase [Anaerolineales bacterium]
MSQLNLSPLEYEILAGIDSEEVINFLQDLIRQRSDYPPGDCRSAIRVVANKLAAEGIGYAIFARQDHQPNLIAGLGHSNRKPSLMYHAHIDTVPAGDLSRWSVDPFSGERKVGRVYGRGAGDDKGSVAAQVMALVTLARAEVNFKVNLRVVVVSD